MEKNLTKTMLIAIKDALKFGKFVWVDTGKQVEYEDLLNVLEITVPISYLEAKQIYFSLSNDIRIKRKKTAP